MTKMTANEHAANRIYDAWTLYKTAELRLFYYKAAFEADYAVDLKSKFTSAANEAWLTATNVLLKAQANYLKVCKDANHEHQIN